MGYPTALVTRQLHGFGKEVKRAPAARGIRIVRADLHLIVDQGGDHLPRKSMAGGFGESRGWPGLKGWAVNGSP